MKHPVLENRVRMLVWWLAWLTLALGQSVLFYFVYGNYIDISLIDSLISLAIYSGIALSLWYPFQFLNAGEKQPTVLVSNLVLSGGLSVGLWILITKYVLTAVLPESANYIEFWTTTLPYRIGAGVFIYCLIILTYYLFVSLKNLSEKNAKAAKLESLVRETELKMLRSQINPHFLFNSLNSISSLTVNNPEKAREMVVKLSEFMRYALSRKDEQPVSLSNELENLNLYLDIEKVRFGDKLTTEELIEPECLNIKIPVMILQPLYENAVKHGVYESTESVRITTRAEIIDKFIKITISNTFDANLTKKIGTGTGLLNVARRLEIFYNKKASMNTAKENDVYSVTIYIPKE